MGIYMCGDIYGIYMCGGESERGPPLRLCGVYVAMWGCMCGGGAVGNVGVLRERHLG